MKAHEADLEVREQRLRRTAARRGLIVTRSRSRDALAPGFGTYTVKRGDQTLLTGGNLDDVERAISTPPTAAAA